MRARQTEDFSRSETFKAHCTFLTLVVSISRCLAVTCCLLLLSPFVFLCIISTSGTFSSCCTYFCGLTMLLLGFCFLYYSCSVQSGGCSAISRCDTILFVPPLPPVSPLAVLAAVECQFAARALVVLESTGDLSFFGPVPSTIGTRRRTTSSIPSSTRREKPLGKFFVFSSKFSPKKKNYPKK